MRSHDRAPRFHRATAPDGGSVLDEVSPSLGFLLAAAIRDWELQVEHGIAVPGGVGVRLISIQAHLRKHELGEPLLALAREMSVEGERPSVETGDAARNIREWASGSAAPSIKREFAHLAARLAPDDLDTVLEAARIARDSGDQSNAEAWFRHVIRRARRSGAWAKYTMAFLGLGVLYHRTGNHPAALTVLQRARRVAHRHGLMAEAGSVHHYLIALAAEQRDAKHVYANADAALRCYGAQDPRIPALVHDVARFWLDIGNAPRALPVLEAVLPRLEGSDATICRANLAWAAAAAGDIKRFAAFKCSALQAICRGPRDRVAAEVCLHLGYALEALGQAESARQFACDARHLSDEAAAVYVREKADELLERIAFQAEGTQQLAKDVAEPPETARRGQQLARELEAVVSPSA